MKNAYEKAIDKLITIDNMLLNSGRLKTESNLADIFRESFFVQQRLLSDMTGDMSYLSDTEKRWNPYTDESPHADEIREMIENYGISYTLAYYEKCPTSLVLQNFESDIVCECELSDSLLIACWDAVCEAMYLYNNRVENILIDDTDYYDNLADDYAATYTDDDETVEIINLSENW